jgi:hypothetical protein
MAISVLARRKRERLSIGTSEHLILASHPHHVTHDRHSFVRRAGGSAGQSKLTAAAGEVIQGTPTRRFEVHRPETD